MNKEEQVMTAFRDLFNKMIWLNKFKMEERLNGHKSSEVHCIEYIAKHPDPNVTKLAEAFYMTRGAISKLTKKLISKGLIESYQRADNKKEIYFRLTEKGQAVSRIHDELHQEFQERDQAVFAQITDAQYDSMLRFVDAYRRHLDGEIKKQGLDVTTRNDFE